MLTPEFLTTRFGNPALPSNEKLYMVLWNLPPSLKVGALPSRIYCHKAMIAPLQQAFKKIIETGCINELKTWDGCFNVRKQRGSTSAWSLHAWGLAIDVNAAENGLGKEPVLSKAFVNCFTSSGFDWGGNFSRKDGMHFQLNRV